MYWQDAHVVRERGLAMRLRLLLLYAAMKRTAAKTGHLLRWRRRTKRQSAKEIQRAAKRIRQASSRKKETKVSVTKRKETNRSKGRASVSNKRHRSKYERAVGRLPRGTGRSGWRSTSHEDRQKKAPIVYSNR